jgi:hypothetical protein
VDKDTKILTVALVLMLAAFPLTGIGSEQEITWLWVAGLVVLTLGAIIPPVTRYAFSDDNDNDDEEDDDR